MARPRHVWVKVQPSLAGVSAQDEAMVRLEVREYRWEWAWAPQ